jgi:hypothetical protein
VDPIEAEGVMLAAGFEPLTPYPGSLRPWDCRCLKCGRKSTPAYSAVRYMGTGCRYCAGNLVDPVDALADMRKAGLEPLDSKSDNRGSVSTVCGRTVTRGCPRSEWAAAASSAPRRASTSRHLP